MFNKYTKKQKMKKKFMMNSIVKVGLCMIYWIVLFCISNIFAASATETSGKTTQSNLIRNTSCIEYTTQSWLTWTTCDNVTITYEQTLDDYKYFVQKRQKTWNMTNFTTWQVIVESGWYIQYKVDFGSITWECRNGTIKDILPPCVKYISSEIYNVSWTPTFSTWNWYLQYTNFRLNNGSQWYILITWQILANTRNCEGTTRYENTWAFKCWNPSTNWMYSNVVAIRTWWWGGWDWSWADVEFKKDWNKYELIPGETWLTFTMTIKNKWPNSISNIYIDDIWPNQDCIIYDWWTWRDLEYLWNYKRHYTKGDGTLWAKKSFSFKIYAKIKDDPSCVWSYINTWRLTYEVWWKWHVLYDKYPFIVVDAGAWYDVFIEKNVNKQLVRHWENIIYTIKYTNIWTKPLTNYTITDNRPDDKLEFISSNPQTTPNNWNTITWFFQWPLAPWKSGVIKINAKVK